MKIYHQIKKNPKQEFVMLHMTKKEACEVIASLAVQCGANNPNHPRRQDFLATGEKDFTVGSSINVLLFVDSEDEIIPEEKTAMERWLRGIPEKDREEWEKTMKKAQELWGKE